MISASLSTPNSVEARTCEMIEKTNAMSALRIAKKELRVLMRQLLSSVSDDSIIGQCA